jgi:hypothetical protein
VYRLATSKRVSRIDTAQYEACCREKNCGYGYVSALIYGEGLYATGEETRASGRVDFMFAGADGAIRIRTIHKRNVRGWIAAVLRVTDPAQAQNLTPFGVIKDLNLTEETAPELVKREYGRSKLSVESQGHGFVFKDGLGAIIGENEFVRRYADVTGSDELSDVDRRRNWHVVGIAALPALAGLAQIGIGLAQLPWLRPAEGAVCGELGCTLVITGAVTIAGSMPYLGYTLASSTSRDGAPEDHALTELDARLLVTRYNRALLRKTVRTIQKGRPGAASRGEEGPRVRLHACGISGVF